jgi:hypothetical protein
LAIVRGLAAVPGLVLAELGRSPRGVVVLGVDGLGFWPAVSAFRDASLLRLTGTVPTTSATGWLTALTGASVAEHGVPGMVYRVGDALVYAVTAAPSRRRPSWPAKPPSPSRWSKP